MPGTVTVIEERGQPTIPADADFAVCVIGYTTANPLGAGPGPVSTGYSSPSAAAAAWGLGDAVDCLTQAITATQGNPQPPPVCIYQTPATTPGVRGATLTTSGVTGTAVITKTASTNPVGTYQPRCRVVTGGLIGTSGIVLQGSLDDGRTWLPTSALGTAFTWKIQLYVNGVLTDTGIQYDFAPSTTNAAYVALVVEMQADTLAHLANAIAHDGADTSAAQVALAASSVPATVSASTAVVNLVLAAMISHVVNITSVHDGPDKTAATALALLSPATDAQTGIALAIALKGIINTHLAATYANSAAGLKAATATVAAPTTYTAATDFLAGGVVALDANPRRLVFTTAGVTPSDAPASVTITGFDYANNAQTESALALAQTAASVTSAKAWKGTGLSAAYLAADGTAATIAIGYANGVHNSADSTNIITATDPTYGTLIADDVWYESITTPPQWAVADLYAAGPPASGAFQSIAQSSTAFAIVAISEPVTASHFPTLTAGLNYLATFGKRVALLTRFRDPTPGETDAQYVAAFQTFAEACSDDRITTCFGSGWLTDAFRSHVYFRSGMPAVLARMQSMSVVPGSLGERIAQSPGFVGRGPLEGFSLVDSNRNPIDQAHDEAVLGGIDGPIGGNGGGLAFYYQRRDTLRGTYVSKAPLRYTVLPSVLNWMDRRVANLIETLAESIAFAEIQGADIYDPTTNELDPDIRNGIETKIQGEIKKRYSREFQNASDPNLVVVNPTVGVDGDDISIEIDVYWRPFGYTNSVVLRFRVVR